MLKTQPLWRLSCRVVADEVGEVENAFAADALATEIEELADGNCQITILLPWQPMAERIDFLGASVSVVPMPQQDWMATVVRGATQAGPFTLSPIGPGIDASADTILVDGRYAFGDGHHPTTIGCIEAMHRLQTARIKPERVADIGCGTGILALAAAKLWPEAEVIASDCEDTAIAATDAGARANGINLQVFKSSGFEGHIGAYDLIVMNLLLQPLLALAADTARYLAAGGCCILSGILPEQTEAVVAAYTAQGLGELPRTQHDGWMTLMFRTP